MPNLLPDDVLKTAKTILVHWPQVSAALPKALTLQGNYALANFTSDLNALDSLLQAMPGVENAYGLALNERDTLKVPLKTRLKQFRAAVQSELTDSSYAKELPTQPIKTLGEAAFLKPFDDMSDLWKRINTDPISGFTPPLTLAGEYDNADFTIELSALRSTYQKTRTVIDAAEQARARRNAHVKTLWERIKQYRKGCIAKLSSDNTLLKNIP